MMVKLIVFFGLLIGFGTALANKSTQETSSQKPRGPSQLASNEPVVSTYPQTYIGFLTKSKIPNWPTPSYSSIPSTESPGLAQIDPFTIGSIDIPRGPLRYFNRTQIPRASDIGSGKRLEGDNLLRATESPTGQNEENKLRTGTVTVAQENRLPTNPRVARGLRQKSKGRHNSTARPTPTYKRLQRSAIRSPWSYTKVNLTSNATDEAPQNTLGRTTCTRPSELLTEDGERQKPAIDWLSGLLTGETVVSPADSNCDSRRRFSQPSRATMEDSYKGGKKTDLNFSMEGSRLQFFGSSGDEYNDYYLSIHTTTTSKAATSKQLMKGATRRFESTTKRNRRYRNSKTTTVLPSSAIITSTKGVNALITSSPKTDDQSVEFLRTEFSFKRGRSAGNADDEPLCTPTTPKVNPKSVHLTKTTQSTLSKNNITGQLKNATDVMTTVQPETVKLYKPFLPLKFRLVSTVREKRASGTDTPVTSTSASSRTEQPKMVFKKRSHKSKRSDSQMTTEKQLLPSTTSTSTFKSSPQVIRRAPQTQNTSSSPSTAVEGSSLQTTYKLLISPSTTKPNSTEQPKTVSKRSLSEVFGSKQVTSSTGAPHTSTKSHNKTSKSVELDKVPLNTSTTTTPSSTTVRDRHTLFLMSEEEPGRRMLTGGTAGPKRRKHGRAAGDYVTTPKVDSSTELGKTRLLRSTKKPDCPNKARGETTKAAYHVHVTETTTKMGFFRSLFRKHGY